MGKTGITLFLVALAGASLFLLYGVSTSFNVSAEEDTVKAPCDKIGIDDIDTFSDKVVINELRLTKGPVRGTGSMLPTISPESTILYKRFDGEKDTICVGDIITFNEGRCGNLRPAAGGVIHRVIGKSEDAEGAYFLTKGDNNQKADDCKVRPEDINLVVVGIIY